MLERKIQWCLEKAKKELPSGKKHRGLLRVSPDLEEAKAHVAKAEHNLQAAIYLEKVAILIGRLMHAFIQSIIVASQYSQSRAMNLVARNARWL